MIPLSSLERPPSAAVYGAAVRAVRELFAAPEDCSADLGRRLTDCCEKLIVSLAQSEEIVALSARSTADHYLYGHSVNTAVVALRLATGLGWPRQKLLVLGLGALTHDIGLRPWLDLAAEKRALSRSERRQIGLRRSEGARLLSQISSLFDHRTLARLLEDSGQGPDDLRLVGAIIDVADAYDSLSHPRPWRKQSTPHEAVKTILRDGSYDREVRRLFVRRLSVYPPGSYVRLTTGEVARVARVREDDPLSPLVAVLLSESGHLLVAPEYLDLHEARGVQIDRAIDETRLAQADRPARAAFAAARWWLDA